MDAFGEGFFFGEGPNEPGFCARFFFEKAGMLKTSHFEPFTLPPLEGFRNELDLGSSDAPKKSPLRGSRPSLAPTGFRPPSRNEIFIVSLTTPGLDSFYETAGG